MSDKDLSSYICDSEDVDWDSVDYQDYQWDPPAAPVQIHVTTLDGKTHTFTVSLSDTTVHDLMIMIHIELGTPVYQQRLVFNEYVMQASVARLWYHGIRAESIMELVAIPAKCEEPDNADLDEVSESEII